MAMDALINSLLTNQINLAAFSCMTMSLHSSSAACTIAPIFFYSPAQSTRCCFPAASLGRTAARSSTKSQSPSCNFRKPICSITALPNGFATASAGSGEASHRHFCERSWVSTRGTLQTSWVVEKVARHDLVLPPAVLLGELTVSPEEASGESASQVAADQTVEGAANNFISVLAVAAFLALFILTIGVIYLSVSDFMEKRNTDAQKKNAEPESKKKAEVEENAARIGPKGFGKKIRKRK